MQRTILLNQVARAMRPFEDVAHELAGVTESERVEWLDDMILAVDQSQPTPSDVASGIAASNLKVTHTACVVLLAKSIGQALSTIRRLPAAETEKSFRALTAVLAVSDARRRAACGASCSHWWHADLNDPRVVAGLLQS